MKIIGIIAMLAAAPASAAIPAARQPFDFRGATAGLDVPSAVFSKCEAKQPDLYQCSEGGVQIAGVSATVVTDYYKSRLSRMLLASPQSNWTTIRRAYIAKYGDPCLQSVEDWKSAGGVSIKNIVETWCFASGKLTLRQYGYELTLTDSAYQDDNRPPDPKPKVDF